MFDIPGVASLLIVAGVFYWLASRANRVRNPFLKWLGMGPAIFVAAIAIVLTITALIGFQRLNFTGSRPHHRRRNQLRLGFDRRRVAREEGHPPRADGDFVARGETFKKIAKEWLNNETDL